MGKKLRHKRELRGLALKQGRNVILFDDAGSELEEPTGTRQQKRAEVRRREKEMYRVLREHDRQVIQTTAQNAPNLKSQKD
jgi:hypothetical protein